MSDSDWLVGDPYESSGEWAKNGVEVTTGSATAAYWGTGSDGSRLYLQNDNTLAATPNAFPLTYSASLKWRRASIVPSSMGGRVIHEEIRHSDPALEVYEFEHRVTAGSGPTGTTQDGAHVRGA